MFQQLRILALSSALLGFTSVPALAQEEKKPVFTNAVADIGIVVKDLEKSAKFYTEVIGMTEVKGFDVPAEKATAFGLTDNQPASIRVFVMDNGKEGPQTKFKLMSFPKAPGKAQDQKFIHSTVGFSYLTLFVTDMNASMERLKKAKVKLLGETPASLGGKNHIAVFHDPDGNFIEFIGPME
ncbi:MAG: VOC family protein [Akkermansiaceae bacterium]|jgi:catechol 2,3-dioxygenase-like lactoylglutathione lyase family enzyme